MGTLMIQVQQLNCRDKKSALVQWDLPFDKSSDVEFVKKVLDIKALASTWEGIRHPQLEYVAEYKDITQLAEQKGLESNITSIERTTDDDIEYHYMNGETEKIKAPQSSNLQDYVDAINKNILEADSKLY